MAVPTTPLINILGEKVALGPLMRDHIPLIARWRNDFFVQRTFGDIPRARTIEEITTRYEDWAGGNNAYGNNAYWFIIYERATWRPVGHTDLFDVDWRGRTCTFGILLGEADARGKGIGSEATRLMLDYAFTALGLHSVMLNTDSFNLAGQAAYRKAGFKEIGRRRQCSFLNGALHDIVYMDCLATEFTSPVLSQIFTPDTPRPTP
jgi:RimJ/RimL family protein N-acetyltransferase